MISTLVQLIVIMPYNHSYDRQLLIPASFECFSLSQLHGVDGGNGPASTDTDTHRHTHRHTHTHHAGSSFGLLCLFSSLFFYQILLQYSTGHCPAGIASHIWLGLLQVYSIDPTNERGILALEFPGWPNTWPQILGKHITLTLFQALDHSSPTCKWQQGSCRRRGNKPGPWWWTCKFELQYLALG